MEYKLRRTSLWRFEERGNWGTHQGDYSGNWSPHVPRNLILNYTNENDLVLDTFLGSGTTMIECNCLNRKGIGIDVSIIAVDLSKSRVKEASLIKIYQGDARELKLVENNSVDFICTHPPYADAIKYSLNDKNDLSWMNIEDFLYNMDIVAREHYRVLKNNKYCAIMMGDIRKNGSVYPLGFKIMEIYLNSGFKLKEIIIKEQFNCSKTKFWLKIASKQKFYLLAHEYIFVFRKLDI